MKKLIFIFIAALTLTACGDSENKEEITTETTTIKKTYNPSTETTTVETTTETTTTEITTINEPTTEMITTTESPAKTETNIIIDNLQTRNVLNGMKNKIIGKYQVALVNESEITDDDIIALYNYCNDQGDRYNYIIVDFGNGTGLHCFKNYISKNVLNYDYESKDYTIQTQLGYYSIDGNTVNYIEF